MRIITKSPEETEKVAEDFLNSLVTRGVGDHAAVVVLYGDLGAGKTAFTKGIGKALHVSEEITSPTFVIQKNYALSGNPVFSELVHIDAYRLANANEMKKLGWDATLGDPKKLVIVEWAQNIKDIIPQNISKVYFRFVDDTTREITLPE
jgi:tRNA threonylcarbamoyladenosine biosynthesis protein TsaE